MVDVPLLLAFLLAASILTLTPGIDTAMVLRAVATEGRRPAAMGALGIAAGCLAWGSAAAVGLVGHSCMPQRPHTPSSNGLGRPTSYGWASSCS